MADDVATDMVSCALPTAFGEFRLHVLTDTVTGKEHVALTMGQVDDGGAVLTRVHSECLTGDVFHSVRCDCGPQLQHAMTLIAQAGRGVIVYLHQEGRGIGLMNKVRAYALQEQGADTVEANRMLGFADDARTYEGAHLLLSRLGVKSVRLLTNNPAKMAALTQLGIVVEARVALHVPGSVHNAGYLATKINKMGHLAS